MNPEHKSESRLSIFYASPLIFLAACGLLAVIIAVFAVNNFQREKTLMEMALKQEATAILNLVAAGSRNAMRRGFMHGEVSADEWLETISQNIDSSSEHPGLLALYLVDRRGIVRSHSQDKGVGQRVDDATLRLLNRMKAEKQRKMSGFDTDAAGGSQVFRMAMIYLPPAMGDFPMQSNRGRMGKGRLEPPELVEQNERLRELGDNSFALVVELGLEQYRQAVRKQVLQIIILSLVLLLVGIGGLLSLALIQNYRGSQRRLKSMSSFTDTLVSSLPLGLLATTADGTVRACNPSAVSLLNLQGHNLIGRPVEELIGEKVVERLKLQTSREIDHWETDFLYDDGVEKRLHLSRMAIRDEEHNGFGLMLLVQDLSPIRRLEQQLQRAERDAVVGRMAAGVAHELRNPLSSIKGLALLLRSKFADDAVSAQNADLMVEQVERLNRSISELLDYARPGMMNVTAFKLDELLSRAVMLVQTDAESADISITERYDGGECRIEGDRDKLTQVILNLCLNAIQAMESGGTLSITTSCGENTARIEIRDTGSGISADLKEKVFEPYFTTKHEGTGLGLAMSAKIIADHNGTIAIESEVGTGTVVIVELPAQ